MPPIRSVLAAATIALTCTAGIAEAGKGPSKRHPHKPKPAFPSKKPRTPKAPKLPQMPSTPAADPLDQKLSSKVYELRFTASRSISWKVAPQSVGNCQGTTTTEAHGDEEWSIASSTWFVRIVRTGDAYSFVPVPRKGYVYPSLAAMTASGTWSRTAEQTVTHAGGWCGSGQPAPAPAKTDCGSRKLRYTFGVGAQRGKGLWVTLNRQGGEDFETCRAVTPTGMPGEPGANQRAAFDPAEILESKGGGFHFSQDYEGPGQTFGTLEYSVRLEQRD